MQQENLYIVERMTPKNRMQLDVYQFAGPNGDKVRLGGEKHSKTLL